MKAAKMVNPNLLLTFSLIFLFSYTQTLTLSDPPGDARNWKGSGLEWEIATKLNFSSQIRSHDHLLLLVTVPWCGESRFLKKEIMRLISMKDGNLARVKLMVVHRNSEKFLADALGVTEELSFFYYDHGRRFRYEGRRRAETILSSISHLMSLQFAEVPLELLQSEKEVKTFLKSTDAAVLLLEFCGWSSRLLRNNDGGSSESTLPVQNFTEDGNAFESNVAMRNKELLFGSMENQKEIESGMITCKAESALSGMPFLEGMEWGSRNGFASDEQYCTLDEFHRFEAFLQKFTKAARDVFVPPEKLRFGLVLDRSLLPLFGIESSDVWMLIHLTSGCQNCSKVLKEEDDLRHVFLSRHPFLTEIDGDQSYHLSAFPMTQPSIILLIDRSSNLSKVKEESQSALEIFGRFAQQNYGQSQMLGAQEDVKLEERSLLKLHGAVRKVVPDAHDLSVTKFSAGHKIVKVKDNMAFVVINEGSKVIFNRNEDNSAYDFIMQMINHQSSALNDEGNKLSLIAKEAGFQLLSEDFKVKSASLLSPKETSQQGGKIDTDILRDGQKSETTRGALTGDSVVSVGVTAMEDDKHPRGMISASSSEQYKDAIAHGASDANLAYYGNGQEASGQGTFASEDVGADEKHFSKEDTGSYTSKSQNAPYLKEDSSTAKLQTESVHSHHVDGTSDDLDPNVIIESEFSNMVSAEASRGYQEKMEDQFYAKFSGSFYFSDGGHRMLEALTGTSKVPSVVILDPISQQHYVSAESDFTYSSLSMFVQNFLNGSLEPYQRAESFSASPREAPHPPFLNLDFHEANSIPRITARILSELVGQYKGSNGPCDRSSGCSSNRDVLVLFGNSWCGFCMQMELVVREVYRAFQSFLNMLQTESPNQDMNIEQGNPKDILFNVPSIFYIDCTRNHCHTSLKQIGKREAYPALLLFPAGKDVVSYEGDVSVNNVIEFLAAHGSNTLYLNKYKGKFWTQWRKQYKESEIFYGTSDITIHEKVVVNDQNRKPLHSIMPAGEKHLVITSIASGGLIEEQSVTVGSILSATDKLLNASPFDNSTVLVVSVKLNEGFHGLMVNKLISWNSFELDDAFEPLTRAPLFYGGPVSMTNMPLVSLVRKAKEGYVEVYPGLYYGDPYTTSLAVDAIRLGKLLATDYWFFLGFSSWGWDQLFGEIADGAWKLSNNNTHLEEILGWSQS